MAAQFTEIIKWLLRWLSSWRARATNSLPVPVSPWIKTVAAVGATLWMRL